MGAWIETPLYCSGGVKSRASHPVWVRGLKRGYAYGINVTRQSHPVWVRGLKHRTRNKWQKGYNVAPRVGAWIETYMSGSSNISPLVAPRVGAWIETFSHCEKR